MATTKRAYKLQEFVAHSSNVNCLKIGRKTSRVLVTGGEDHKVNVWAIGKPNAILSLSGHMSAVESVNFDSSEVLVAAGATSGSIKLWNLEEAKILRTLTGHRSNCIVIDFHPFGEFFASGSLDTNLKIWDIRRKGCIHTYKGHTRRVNAIKFTPDGRWVVSGGEDNIIKLWDLTAGKLLHEFKIHEGQIQCIDFHPHEFLLASGSADKTVKFWDLETFEFIGSSGPEVSGGVRSMTFNPDGRTLLCGLHESLKVFSWEPIVCHDNVDVGWSRLSDMNIHEGKLLGCSYNQSCVGVWVVDLSRIEPYAVVASSRSNGHSGQKSTSVGNPSIQDDNIKSSVRRLSILQSSETNSKEANLLPATANLPGTPQRSGACASMRAPVTAPEFASSSVKRSLSKVQSTSNLQTNKADIVPVIVPRTSTRKELPSDSIKDSGIGRTMSFDIQAKFTEFRKVSNIRQNSDKIDISIQSGFLHSRNIEQNELSDRTSVSSGNSGTHLTAEEKILDGVKHMVKGRIRSNSFREPHMHFDQENFHKPKETFSSGVSRRGRTRSLINWEGMEPSPSYDHPTSSSTSETTVVSRSSYSLRSYKKNTEIETLLVSDEDSIQIILRSHDQFLNSMQSRLTKLQVVQRLWEKNDVKGVISALERMSDHGVSADVLCSLKDKSDVITLDICTSLLPLLTSLLESKRDRHLSVTLEMLLKLVRIFGLVIGSTMSAGPSVGVDLQAEQRLERCNLCFIELEKVKHSISSLMRRGGSIAKDALELNLALQEVL